MQLRHLRRRRQRFGPAVFITLFESQGNSTFRYQQPLTSITTTTINSGQVLNTRRSGAQLSEARGRVQASTQLATIPRELTFFNTSAERAQPRLANNPEEYARLLGLSRNSAIVRRGFGALRPRFACRPYREAPVVSVFQVSPNRTLTDLARLSTNSITSVVSRLPINEPAVFLEGAAAAAFIPNNESFSTLPDGNYRVTIGALPDSTATQADNESLLSPTSPLFTFRKRDNLVTGLFEYPDEGLNACVTGTLEGNTVSGQAFANSSGTFVISENYLGPSLSLRLGGASGANRYDDATLDLNGFSRISAGTVAPPTRCG